MPSLLMRTEQAHAFWVNRFLAFCREGGFGTGNDAVRAFLERLVVAEGMSASTQGQALNALSFYFHHVVEDPFGDLGEFQRSKRPRRLPVVLGREEVRRLIAAEDEAYRLPAALLYGGGLRLMEASRLHVKDVDLERRQIAVWDGKGQKDRVTVLPNACDQPCWQDCPCGHVESKPWQPWRFGFEGELLRNVDECDGIREHTSVRYEL